MNFVYTKLNTLEPVGISNHNLFWQMTLLFIVSHVQYMITIWIEVRVCVYVCIHVLYIIGNTILLLYFSI